MHSVISNEKAYHVNYVCLESINDSCNVYICFIIIVCRPALYHDIPTAMVDNYAGWSLVVLDTTTNIFNISLPVDCYPLKLRLIYIIIDFKQFSCKVLDELVWLIFMRLLACVLI